jgi:hypothetical protein
MLRVFFLDLAYYFKYKLDIYMLIHRLCCIFSGLLMAYCLLMCIFSFSGALDDLYLFQDLGFSLSFGHHLVENNFHKVIQVSIPVIAQFCVYLFLHHRAAEAKFPKISIIYFAVVALLFVCMFVHANALDFAQFPPFTEEGDLRRNYYTFSRTMMLQSAAYLFSYLLRTKEVQTW